MMTMGKTAYLTIDDGPSVDMRAKVDYLAARRIPAVWFCSGEQLAARPEHALYALAHGHVIANHAYDHPAFSAIELDVCFDQIRRTEDLIAALYERAGLPFAGKYFRFPFGDKGGLRRDPFGPYSAEGQARKAELQAFLRRRGYVQPAFADVTYPYLVELGLRDDADWTWTYDCFEWSIFAEDHYDGIDSIDAVFAAMDRDDPENGFGLHTASAEVVLMHDHADTASYFAPIVERLVDKGLAFVLPAHDA
ncbi:MAG: polysaccharide deacetylase family protein [Deltaproteobacteria bacterium]|nr:MAG: polysaccharide deacetylase family protein [Deltaproteobacteria bacterium]TMQ15741.1 MAG: polysaccharide deacetylase family protein [Deltaproteobacteria bacterium]